MWQEIAGVFCVPRFQRLPRQFQVSCYLPVVVERDVVVFPVADRIPELIRLGDTLRAKFRLPEGQSIQPAEGSA